MDPQSARTKAEKACSKCARVLPLGEFRVIVNTKTGRRRWHSWCNRCKGEYEAAKRRAKREFAARGIREDASKDEQQAAREMVQFRSAEAARVLAYQANPDVKARRSRRSVAQYRALADLRSYHLEEFQLIQLRAGKGYPALAALRDAHRDEYAHLYSLHLRRLGLDPRPTLA